MKNYLTINGKKTTYEEFCQQFKNPDGSIAWGKAATAWMEKEEIINNQLSTNKQDPKIKSHTDLPVFQMADKLSDDVWQIVSEWNYFAKKTVGDQWVRAADSIAANIAEGYGRYFFADYRIFLYYSRGSAVESLFWLEKAHNRGLIIDNQLFNNLKERFEKIPLELNKLIKLIKSQQKDWKGKPW